MPKNYQHGPAGAGKKMGHKHKAGADNPINYSKSKGLIAISAEESHMKSQMDPRFGRCNYFLMYDPANGLTHFMGNPGKQSQGGAGPAAAEFLINHGVSKVISGEFGARAKEILEAANVEMVTLIGQGDDMNSLIEKVKN